MFDGVIATSPARGAAASTTVSRSRRRDGHPYLNFFYPTDIFPFTDVAQRDPETGVTDGLLTHAGRRTCCRRSSTPIPRTNTGAAPHR